MDKRKSKDGEETWEKVDDFQEPHVKIDAKKGFTFSQYSAERRMPEPGEYRLTYTLHPVNRGPKPASAEASAAAGRRGRGGAAASQAYPTMPALKAELFFVIQPSLPCSMRIERVAGESNEFALWKNEKLRVLVVGRGDLEVQLSAEVQAKYRNLVTVAIRAQMEHSNRTLCKPPTRTVALGSVIINPKKSTRALASTCR